MFYSFIRYVIINEWEVYLMEEWRDIKGFEGLYAVSNTGLIKSLERFIINNGIKQKKEWTNIEGVSK